MAATTVVSSAYDTSGAGGRKIVNLPNGTLVAGTKTSTSYTLYKSTDNGQTWTSFYTSATLTSLTDIALASDSSNNVFVAMSWNGANVNVRKILPDGSSTQSATVDSSQTAVGNVSLTIDNAGVLHAAWVSKNSTYPNSNNIRYSKSTDGGATWAAVTQVTQANSSGTDNLNPCIVIKTNGSPKIFCSQSTTGNSSIIALDAIAASPQGTVYSPSANYSQYNPCAVVDSIGTIHVVWYGTDSTDTTQNNIRYSKSSDGGSTWSAMVKLTSGNTYTQSAPTITVDAKDRLYVYWQGVDSAVNATYLNVRRIIGEPQGASWGSIKTLTSNSTAHDQNIQTPWQITYTPDRFARYIYMDNQNTGVKYNMDNNVQIAAWSAYDTSGNGGRKVVQLSNGWLVGAVRNGGIYFYVSKDNGQTWTLLTTANFTSDAGFAITSTGTTVYAFICQTSTGFPSFAKFDATTVGSSVAGSASPESTQQTSFGSGVSLTIDSAGTLHAAWCSKNSTYPNSFNIRYSKSTDGGATWATPSQLSGANVSGADFTNPCITVSGTIPYVVAQETTSTTGNIYVFTTKYTTKYASMGDAAWGNQIVYNIATYSQANPCAVVDGAGNIHVVWYGEDATYPSANNVKYSKSTDGGSTWSAMVNLTTGNSYSQQYPSIVADGSNNLHVFWHGIDSAVTTSCNNVRRIINIGGTWGSIYTVTNNTTASSQQYLQALYANNTVSYIWQDNQNNQVRFNSYSANSVALTGLDTSGNGGRKLVKLSNGWLVAAALDNTSSSTIRTIYFYVSKDNGVTWAQLTYATVVNGASITVSTAVTSSGTNVYCLYGLSTGWALLLKFDATTVTNTDQVNNKIQVDMANTNGSGVSLVIDGTGTLHAAWCSKTSTVPNSFNIRYSKSTDGGSTWATVTQVTNNNTANYDSTNPCIVVRSNNYPSILYSFENNTTSPYIIQTANWNGTAWSIVAAYTASGTSYAQFNPCAAVDSNDNIHVVWHGVDSTDPNQNNIRYSKSTDGGATWSAMAKLTSGNAVGNALPSIAIDAGNNLYVYWYGYDPFVSIDYTNIRTVKNTAGTWGAISTITNNVFNNALYPQVGWQKFNGWTDAIRLIYQDTQRQVDSYYSVTLNTAPNAPTYSNMSSSGGSYNKRPKIFVNVSDPDTGNTLTNVEIQISTDNTFATTNFDVQYGSDSGYGTTTAGWGGLPTATNTTTMINWLPQADLPTGTLYARVRTKDNNGAWSVWSATQQFSVLAVPWADTPNGYGMKATWLNDLATAINNVRQFRGIAPFTFTDGTLTAQDAMGNGPDIKALHITERRTKIGDVYTTLGATAPTPTNATIDNTKDRSGQDIIDLRTAVLSA